VAVDSLDPRRDFAATGSDEDERRDEKKTRVVVMCGCHALTMRAFDNRRLERKG